LRTLRCSSICAARRSALLVDLRCSSMRIQRPGQPRVALADRLGISKPTLTKWRSWSVARRLEGLADEPWCRSHDLRRARRASAGGHPGEIMPKDAAHWSTRSLACPSAWHVAVGGAGDASGALGERASVGGSGQVRRAESSPAGRCEPAHRSWSQPGGSSGGTKPRSSS
jgi:hypothetical protein